MNRMNNKKGFYIIISIFVFFLLGYFRDYLFVNINDALYYISHNSFPVQHSVDNKLTILLELSYSQLYYTKWMLTIIFSAAFLILSMGTLKFFFAKEKYFQPLLFIYIFLIIISSALTLLGILLKDNTWTYKISRFLMGISQSPLPLMIIIFALKLSNNNNNSK